MHLLVCTKPIQTNILIESVWFVTFGHCIPDRYIIAMSDPLTFGALSTKVSDPSLIKWPFH